ncbi:hypothetical protein [Saccharopolyspora sp. NFXS83]|uniref:hypothetical protein n=1 Tax=Saccharopolyspora sp. NFXS83 TaxID=2993560 RepID=UPI00224B8082|nr:hypothetical protein [Saccharopolyspora sp. NFXS83]
MRTFRKLLTAVVGSAVLAGSGLLATTGTAIAAPEEGIGHETTPGQPYAGIERDRDWLGSYIVGGNQVWCVRFALKAPDTGEQYEPGDELLTKWGTPLEDDVAANISYLLLRYGNTESPDEAAALAHLLHSWTSAPRDEGDLDPGLPFDKIGYDIDFQLGKLPQGAKDAVETLRADAEKNRGPWEAALTAPEDPQVIGEAADWTFAVDHPDGTGVTGVPVKITATDAEVEGLGEDGTITTPDSGDPLQLKVTPTGPNPKLEGELATPAERPYVQQAVENPDGVQRVVSTGGEKQVKVEDVTTAVTAPGKVAVGKIDEESKAGIAGVALRVSLPDDKPALKQDGTELTGPDGQPAVVTTGDQGTVEIADLRTPQEIKITEVAPAKGYEEAFDAANPPSVVGTVEPGGTLTLTVTNKANTPTVPIFIPAGDPGAGGGVVAAAEDTGALSPGLLGLGALTLTGAAVAGGAAWRKRLVSAGER